MTPEFDPMDPALEKAMKEIRDDVPDPAAADGAAARVWARLGEAAAQPRGSEHIRNCADFQALIPEYRAKQLSQARTLLVGDHLHQCVHCRRVFEQNVVASPLPQPAKEFAGRSPNRLWWAIAAAVVAAAGVAVWLGVRSYGTGGGHAIVASVNGTLFEVAGGALQPLLKGQDLPRDVEIRTAKDSNAVLKLADGSLVEMRERSSLSTAPSGGDITVRLGRGSVIVTAAHRRSGHLYVSTPDSRVAVTGTLFSVIAGVKGSRISVVQGEVRVTENTQEKILRPGDQMVTGASVLPESIRADVAWSRDRDSLLRQLNSLRTNLIELHLGGLRYSSNLLARVPASTVFVASIPNLAEYLGEAQSVVREKLADNPQLGALLAGKGASALAMIEHLRAASLYLGDEVLVVSFRGSRGALRGPVFLAEPKREGFNEFLSREGASLSAQTRPGLLVFGMDRESADAAVAALDSGFRNTPLYARLLQRYESGAGLLVGVDLSQTGTAAPAGARYFIAEQKESGKQTVASATLGFDGPRSGLAAVLAAPAPMGSLDYVSPDATILMAFAVNNPSAIVDQLLLALKLGSHKAADRALADASQQAGVNIRDEMAASLGGEFALAMDGSVMPVPSWKLVTEVYAPQRLQATLQKLIEGYSRDAVKAGEKPLRTAQETVDGRTYYMVASANSNPLLEVHYTFDEGYLIAAPTRALVSRALQVKAAGTSIRHSTRFVELTPRDSQVNFSAVIFQNVGNTLAPLAALVSAFVPEGGGRGPGLKNLADVKPSLYAVYGEPDRITMTANGNVLGSALSNLMSGNLAAMAGISPQVLGTPGSSAPYLRK